MNPSMEFFRKSALAYSAVCKPLCHKLKLPQTAFDILMFLANNPDCQTASDIVEIRHIKANLVSINVDRLVQEGYLIREPLPNDRRKTRLVCTSLAQPVIQQGRELQEAFYQALFAHITPSLRTAFDSTIAQINCNLDKILEGAE